MSQIKSFNADWSPEAVAAMLDKVRAYPWPIAPEADDGWGYGCDAAFLKALCAYWTSGYDWRGALAELNRFPQYTARVEDFDLHFVHVVGEAEGKRPLLLSHGWPGSHYEFWGAIDKLAYPSRFGGRKEDAFDVVAPSLPGFGFSSKPKRPFGQRGTARLFNALMTEVLGYDRYLAQGGDWGAVITSWLGFDHAAHARAIHLNMLAFRPQDGLQSDAEKQWAARSEVAGQMFGAYLRLQISKPQSVAWLGAGNPVGQAAWIIERFHDWSDLREKPLDGVYTRDQLLTNVMLYVMTDSFTTGAWYYRGLVEEGGMGAVQGAKCATPTGFARYLGDSDYTGGPPRSYVERAYNLAYWSEPAKGGHFAAMEQPDLFVDDLRAWARDTPA
jgi:pimeloyl-ACP methyl ester carboxylesterase